MQLFVPLTKVDATRQEVWGVLAAEYPDTSGEIFDYSLSKPYFEKWNERFEKVTDGKSFGNLRAMHGNVAAGKFIDFQYDDANKMIHVGAKVVDLNEWKKVTEGVYTGFSIGGKYLKKWADGELTRYVANPSEGSLVDSPCIPVALFQMVKDGGAVEFRKFQRVTTGGSKPMAKELIKGSLLARFCELKKVSADDIHTLLNTLEELDEDQALPKQLKKPVAALVDALESLSVADLKALTVKALADGADPDASTDTGAADSSSEAGDQTQKDGDMSMADKAGDLKKMASELVAPVLAELKKMQDANAAMLARIDKLEKQPAAPKGNVRIVEKEHDRGDTEKKEETIDLSKASAFDLIKLAHQQPLAE